MYLREDDDGRKRTIARMKPTAMSAVRLQKELGDRQKKRERGRCNAMETQITERIGRTLIADQVLIL